MPEYDDSQDQFLMLMRQSDTTINAVGMGPPNVSGSVFYRGKDMGVQLEEAMPVAVKLLVRPNRLERF
jgi:hypothetical protein